MKIKIGIFRLRQDVAGADSCLSEQGGKSMNRPVSLNLVDKRFTF